MKGSNTFLANIIRKRQRDDWDCVIAITGIEGVGKTTEAWDLSRKVDRKFNLAKNFIFSPKTQEAIKQIKALYQYGAVVMDEGIKMAYKLDWQSKAQRLLNKVYTLNRNENKVTIICIPNFLDLSKFFRDHRVYIWIHVYSRGKAVAFIRADNPYSSDIWQLDKNNRNFIKAGRKVLLDADKRLEVFQKGTNFLMRLEFPDMPPKVKALYKELKNKYKYDDLEDEEKVMPVMRQRDDLIVALRNFKSTREIADLIDMSVRRVSTIFKEKRDATVQSKDSINTNTRREKIPVKTS